MTRVGCIICDAQGGVLMIYKDAWEIPGGNVFEGQSPRVVLKDILKRELGIGVRLVRELGKRDDSMWFLGEITSGEPVLQTDRYRKFGFFSLVTLTRRYDELAPSTKTFLEAMAYGTIDLDV